MVKQAEKMMLCLMKVSLLCSVCGEHMGNVLQPASLQTVELGQTVTITCCINSTLRIRVWYKVNTQRRLQLVASVDSLYNLATFREQSHRYLIKSDSISSHLSISAATWDDVGTYFCGVLSLNHIIFASGTFLMIKGAHMMSDSVVQRPESETVQPGGSVNLSCSVHIGQCAAEQTDVMWLKNSHHSTPQMIYSAGSKNPICQSTKSGQTTCVYSLLLRNLSSDEAGTYYCVATSCGQIQFGNGTGINIHRHILLPIYDLSPAVLALILSNIILGMVVLLLVCTLCKKQEKDVAGASISNAGSLEGNQTENAVIYATVRSAPRGSSCRRAPATHSTDTVVYSDILSTRQQINS